MFFCRFVQLRVTDPAEGPLPASSLMRIGLDAGSAALVFASSSPQIGPSEAEMRSRLPPLPPSLPPSLSRLPPASRCLLWLQQKNPLHRRTKIREKSRRDADSLSVRPNDSADRGGPGSSSARLCFGAERESPISSLETQLPLIQRRKYAPNISWFGIYLMIWRV